MNVRQPDQRGVVFPVADRSDDRRRLAGHPGGRAAQPRLRHQLLLQPDRGVRQSETAVRGSDRSGPDAAPDGARRATASGSTWPTPAANRSASSTWTREDHRHGDVPGPAALRRHQSGLSAGHRQRAVRPADRHVGRLAVESHRQRGDHARPASAIVPTQFTTSGNNGPVRMLATPDGTIDRHPGRERNGVPLRRPDRRLHQLGAAVHAD